MRQLIKLILISLALFCFFGLAQTTLATQRIFDQANLFTESQQSQIAEKIAIFEQNTGMEAAVVTTNDAEGKTAKSYADNFYSDHQLGVGEDRSGFLFLIDMDNRTYYILTMGKMKELLTDSRIKKMLNHAEDDMLDGNYHLAALSILKDGLHYSDRYQYDSASGQFKRLRKLTPLKSLIAVIAAVVAGIASYSSVYGTYNLKRSTYKYSYRDKSNLTLTQKDDHLINTFTTTRRIPKPSNSSGGSGGGGGAGGGGRSF